MYMSHNFEPVNDERFRICSEYDPPFETSGD